MTLPCRNNGALSVFGTVLSVRPISASVGGWLSQCYPCNAFCVRGTYMCAFICVIFYPWLHAYPFCIRIVEQFKVYTWLVWHQPRVMENTWTETRWLLTAGHWWLIKIQTEDNARGQGLTSSFSVLGDLLAGFKLKLIGWLSVQRKPCHTCP